MQEPVVEVAPAKPTLWASLREAVAGSEQDFTAAPLGRAILLLAVPMVLESVMESLLALVDALFVARLGSPSVAAVGLTESLLTVVYAVAMGLAMGTTAMVARRTGEKDPEAAASVAIQAIATGIGVALPIAIIGATQAPTLLRWMGASPAVIATGHRFTRLILAGNVSILLLFLINAVFRGAGDAAVAMRALWIANAVNIALDPIFIFGLHKGVFGASLATTMGRSSGVAYQIYWLVRGRGRVVVRRRHLRIEWQKLVRLVRLSVVGIAQILIATTSWMGLVKILSRFGDPVLAAYTIALRIIVFALLPSWGMSNAAATLVGQNLGAKQPERAERAVWRSGLYNMVFLGSVAVVFVSCAEPIVRLFTHDPQVVPTAVACLRFVSYGYPFFAWGMVLQQAFNGAGDTTTPTVMNVGVYWLFEIPLAYLLAMVCKMGPRGVFVAICVAESMHSVVAALIFRRGRWKLRKV